MEILGFLVYHTIRQLRLVSHAYTAYAHSQLFEIGQAYALSWLTARIAIGLATAVLVPILLWFITRFLERLITF